MVILLIEVDHDSWFTRVLNAVRCVTVSRACTIRATLFTVHNTTYCYRTTPLHSRDCLLHLKQAFKYCETILMHHLIFGHELPAEVPCLRRHLRHGQPPVDLGLGARILVELVHRLKQMKDQCIVQYYTSNFFIHLKNIDLHF